MHRTVFDEKTKIWKGDSLITNVEIDSTMSCGTAILKALETYPDEIGQISDNNGVQLTNAEIRIRTIRAAQNLLKLGLTSGDVIQIIARNHHYLAPLLFAAFSIGTPVNALDVKFKKDEVIHFLKIVRPKVIFCDQDVLPVVEEATISIDYKVLVYTFDGEENNKGRSINELFIETHCENDFVINDSEIIKHPVGILCTSGTTGLPKAVSVAHFAFLQATLSTSGNLKHSEDIDLNFGSLYWLSGWMIFIFTTLGSIKRIITTEAFSSDRFLRMVEQYKVTSVFSPPSSMALILQNKNLPNTNLSSIKFYGCGGSIVSHDLCLRMKKYLPNGVVFVVYGLSEVAGNIAMAVKNLQPNSVGQIFPGKSVKILNENGEKLGIGETGEICVLSNIPFLGYYRDEVSTQKTIDEFGWLRTGDIGYFDEDGNLYFAGRKKEILRYFGHQMSPIELENVILKHPGVSNVCVVGVPDDIAGDLPAAVIVKNNLVDVKEIDIINLLKDNLSDPKQPRGGVCFVNEFPETPSGKILKRKVQEIVIKKFKNKNI